MPKTDTKEYYRVKGKERRDRLKAEGLCTVCGKPNDRQERCLCSKCHEKAKMQKRQNYKAYQSMGLCPRCRKEKLFGDEKVCLECRAKNSEISAKNYRIQREHIRKLANESSRIKRIELKEKGICISCHSRKVDGLHSTCYVCRQANLRNWHKKHTEPSRKDKVAAGLCYTCLADKCETGYKVCAKCRQRLIEQARSQKAKEVREELKKQLILY